MIQVKVVYVSRSVVNNVARNIGASERGSQQLCVLRGIGRWSLP